MNKALIALASASLTASATAQTLLDTTVVTASRLEEPADASVRAVSVITREQIERSGARDVSELLRRLPGVQIGRNGGPGQSTSLFLRGTASDHILVLIDGVPAQSATTGAMAFQHIDPETIERIELVRGPASTLYGSSAIGGVIQIFTRKAANRAPRLHGAWQAGNQGTFNASAGVSGGKGPFSAGLTISHQQSNGYPPKSSFQLSCGYRHDTFDAHLGYAPSPDLALEFSHWQSQGNVEYLGQFTNARQDQDVLNAITRFTVDTVHGDDWSSRLLLSRAVDNSDENQISFLTNLFHPGQHDFAHTERLGLDWQHTWLASEAHTLVGGVTLSREQARLLSYGAAYERTSREKAVYLQDDYHAGDLDLQAGVRGLHHSVYGRQFTWNLGAGYQLGPQTHVHANAGTAFRSPSANDLDPGLGGNPDFKPEKSRSFEVGLRQGLGEGQRVELNLFHTRIHDLIEFNPTTFITQQVERARIRGVELGYRLTSGPLSLTLDYTWQNAENLDQKSSLARRAENKLNTSLGYDNGNWWTRADLTAETDRRDSRFNGRVLAAYTTFDLSAGYRLDRDWQAELNVTNLFDEQYELAGDYPAQGRLVLLGLRYSPK